MRLMILLPAAALAFLVLSALTSRAAPDGKRSARVRIDAYGYLRWKNAPIDASRGVRQFRFNLNAANGGRTSGGFRIQEPGWLTGTVYRMDVDPASIKKPVGSKPADPSISPRATVYASCEANGAKYRLEFQVTGDVFDSAHGKSIPGTVKLRLIGPLGQKGTTPPVQEAFSVAGTRVRNLVYWPDSRRPDTNLGGPVMAPSGP